MSGCVLPAIFASPETGRDRPSKFSRTCPTLTTITFLCEVTMAGRKYFTQNQNRNRYRLYTYRLNTEAFG
jgi:hypothetical protein